MDWPLIVGVIVFILVANLLGNIIAQRLFPTRYSDEQDRRAAYSIFARITTLLIFFASIGVVVLAAWARWI